MKNMLNYSIYCALCLLLLISCGENDKPVNDTKEKIAEKQDMNSLAEKYVKLALQVGKYDDNYVDAYYGPDSLKNQAALDSLELPQIKTIAEYIINELKDLDTTQLDDMQKLRKKFLNSQVRSLNAHVDFLQGVKMTFDDESQLIYDAVSPTYQENYYQKILIKLDSIVPGKGDLRERYVEYRKKFKIPKDRMDTLFQVAIDEARKRTKENIRLADNENFVIEYVTNKPWGAYNWYKGNAFSLIEMNTDLPIYIDRVIDLACHEGYPGHHVYHQLMEKHLVKERGWVEFSIYPLFSPQSLISEGAANYGIEVVFPPEERMEYEKSVLFPIAGIDPELADQYYEILGLLGRLSYVSNDVARKYLDGKCSRSEAVKEIMKFKLRTESHANKNVDFFEKYRSYVINYNLGYDLVKAYIENNGGTDEHPQKRWKLFSDLLSKPVIPSDLK